MWFVIALLGYLCIAVTSVLDKFILSTAQQKPAVYTFYSTIFLLGLFLFVPAVGTLHDSDWRIALLSGVAFGGGLLTLYHSVRDGEASHLYPFNGAILAVGVLVISFFTVGERLSRAQEIGIGFLILSALILSLEKARRSRHFDSGFFWAGLSGLLFAVSLVATKYLYERYAFFTALVWTQGMTGVTAIVFLLSPTVRHQLGNRKKKAAVRQPLWIIAIDKFFGALGTILIQYAIAIGSVTVVSALAGAQYGFLFLLLLFGRRLWPRVIRERFTRSKKKIEIIALGFVSIGLALFM